MGHTKLCPSHALRSQEVTPAAAVQEPASTAYSRHLLPGKTSVLPTETHKSFGAGSEKHCGLPTEGLGFNTFSPVQREQHLQCRQPSKSRTGGYLVLTSLLHFI